MSNVRHVMLAELVAGLVALVALVAVGLAARSPAQ
jgi:hypothetical protein